LIEHWLASLIVLGPLLALATIEVVMNGQVIRRFTQIVTPEPPDGGDGVANDNGEALAGAA
jgi:hypothetical protein